MTGLIPRLKHEKRLFCHSAHRLDTKLPPRTPTLLFTEWHGNVQTNE